MEKCFLLRLFFASGRDSPVTNEGGEEQDEPMPVPEDLSASTGLQHNNRTDKPAGESGQCGHHHRANIAQLQH